MSPRPAASRMTRADSGDNGLGCKTGTQRRREICWIMINYSNFAGSSISAAIDCARRLDAFESLLLRRWLYLISWLYLIRPCTEFSSVGLAKPSTANMRGKARRFVAGMAASSDDAASIAESRDPTCLNAFAAFVIASTVALSCKSAVFLATTLTASGYLAASCDPARKRDAPDANTILVSCTIGNRRERWSRKGDGSSTCGSATGSGKRAHHSRCR